MNEQLEECLQSVYENEDRDECLNDLFSLHPVSFKLTSHETNHLLSFNKALSEVGHKYFNPERLPLSSFGEEYLDFLSLSRRVYDPSFLEKEPYYQALMKLPPFKEGTISFEKEAYQAYQPFVCGDRVIKETLSSYTPLGCFDNKISYPALKQDGRIWMSLIPHEINTMKDIFAFFKGDVLLYGLGLGYACFEAARKSEVTSVTVIEKDPTIIALFKTHFLPLFINKDKVKIVEEDAVSYAKGCNKKFDVSFADLWHDGMDGMELYGKLLSYENNAKQNFYWIENDILEYFSRIYLRYILSKTERSSKKDVTLEYGEDIASLFERIEAVKPYSPDKKENLLELFKPTSLKVLLASIFK